MKSHDTINDVLVNLFNEIWKIEEEAIINGEFTDISVNDMHIIEAISKKDGNNMSIIAKKLDITVGSLTTSMNGLVRKGYAVRERSEADRRVVYIKLTQKGIRAYIHHENFHKQMTKAVIDSLDNEQEVDVLVKALKGLSVFFRDQKK